MKTATTSTIAALFATLAVVLAAGSAGCGGGYYSDAAGRFHLQMPMSMATATTARGVRMEPGNETVVLVDSVETAAADLAGYLDTELDAAALAHGDRFDLTLDGLEAARFEFRGGIDIGGGLPLFPNLVIFVIKDGGTVHRLTCSGPDGPFDNFCMIEFEQMVMTFTRGPHG